MTMSILFFYGLENAIVTFNAWNKKSESIFQITRGQWGNFLQPWTLSCCVLWVRYG